MANASIEQSEQSINEIPYGYCHCGCGQKTKLSEKTRPKWGHVKGEPRKYLCGHNAKNGNRLGKLNGRWNGGSFVRPDGYVAINKYMPNKVHNYIMEHVLIAERVLGKPLPPKAVVHHSDGNRENNTNRNLVICEDTAYHLLLHKRQRALKACGHASWGKCRYCGKWDDPKNLRIYPNDVQHNECANKHHRERRAALLSANIPHHQ